MAFCGLTLKPFFGMHQFGYYIEWWTGWEEDDRPSAAPGNVWRRLSSSNGSPSKKKQFFCAEDFNSQSINHGWQKSTCYTYSFSACLHHLIVVRSKLLTSALLLFYRCFCAKKHQSTSLYLSPSYWANLKYDHTESSENKLVEALQKNNIWTIQIQFDSVSCQTQLNTKVNKKWRFPQTDAILYESRWLESRGRQYICNSFHFWRGVLLSVE